MATRELVEQDTERRALPREHTAVTKEQELDHFIAQANEARRDYENAAKEYRDLAHFESALEAQRPVLRELIKLRLMDDEKLAATNAEKQATTDKEYLAHLKMQRDTVRTKDDAFTRAQSAQLRAQTAIAACRAIGGWV